MKKSDTASMRRQYSGTPLLESEVPQTPLPLFEIWYAQAIETSQLDWMEPHAMSLATADAKGRVTCRTVLLREYDEDGFVFYTNYESVKGSQIAQLPNVCLLFYWAQLSRQIRIEGACTKTDRDKSERYFHSRPRGSQISAAISRQSREVADREQLEKMARELEASLKGATVPLPDDWGGYSLRPERFEFWQGREDRLHDRIGYERLAEGVWRRYRLSP